MCYALLLCIFWLSVICVHTLGWHSKLVGNYAFLELMVLETGSVIIWLPWLKTCKHIRTRGHICRMHFGRGQQTHWLWNYLWLVACFCNLRNLEKGQRLSCNSPWNMQFWTVAKWYLSGCLRASLGVETSKCCSHISQQKIKIEKRKYIRSG